ncbi:MAG: hypothetical protein R2873_20865 [Caldilineaceae bacterium]
MDANGLRFWLLADRKDWRLVDAVTYDDSTRRLRLRGELTELPAPPANADSARPLVDQIPAAFDSFGARAFLDGDRIRVASKLPTAGDLTTLPAAAVVTDLAMGYDGVLYVALDGDVLLLDTRDRWQPARVHRDGFVMWRLAPDPSGGAWALDRDNRQLGQVTGLPLANRVFRDYSAEVARPIEEDADPPRLRLEASAAIPAAETPVGIACSQRGVLALLTWLDDAVNPADARLRFLDQRTGELSSPVILNGAALPVQFRLAQHVADRPAPGQHTCRGAGLRPEHCPASVVRRRGPARRHPVPTATTTRCAITAGVLLKGVTTPPHYPSTVEGQSPLHPLVSVLP